MSFMVGISEGSISYCMGPCAYEKVGSCAHMDQLWYIKDGETTRIDG